MIAIVSKTMTEEARPPKLVVPIVVTVCAGILSLLISFGIRKFQLLFVTASAVWILFLFYLYRRWWPGVPFVPGQRKIYKGVAVVVGFLIFAAAWYLMIHLDPSLR